MKELAEFTITEIGNGWIIRHRAYWNDNGYYCASLPEAFVYIGSLMEMSPKPWEGRPIVPVSPEPLE